MNRVLIFILIISFASSVQSAEIPSITLMKNSNGALAFKISLKTAGKIKVDWGNNDIKTYDVNASSRSLDATNIIEDVKKNTTIKIYGDGIRIFYCQSQFISSLDVSNATELTTLDCSRNDIKEIDLKNNRSLRNFNCHENRIKTLDLSHNPRLTHLTCSYNYIRSLSLEKNNSLQVLTISDNNIKEISLENHKSLSRLSVSGNKLSALEVKQLTGLQYLDVSYNKFSVCGLNKIFTDVLPIPEDKKSEKKNLIIVHNRGFVRSNTALAIAKNWNPDIEGSGKADCN